MSRWRTMLLIGVATLLLDLVPAVIWWTWHVEDQHVNATIRRVQLAGIGFVSFLLGLGAATRHPAMNSAYRKWLLTTPWRAGLPLPLGSVVPSAAEYFVLAVFTMIVALHMRMPIAVPLMAFMLALVLPAAVMLLITGPRLAAVALWFVMPLLARMAPNVAAMLIVSVALYAIACAGMQHSLLAYPWDMDKEKLPKADVGPVFERLGPRAIEQQIKGMHAVVVSLLAGWWLYCFIAPTRLNAATITAKDVAAATWLIGGLLGLFRWAHYCGPNHPPISFWGRIRTGRLILPGYDYVLITPLCAAIVGALAPGALLGAGASPAAAMGSALTMTLMVLLIGPPSMAHWQLTGHHRIMVAKGSSGQQRKAV